MIIAKATKTSKFPIFHIGKKVNGMKNHYIDYTAIERRIEKNVSVINPETIKNNAKTAKKVDFNSDPYNHFSKVAFPVVLEKFLNDKKYVYPVAVAVTISAIKQNFDPDRNNEFSEMKWFTPEEMEVVANNTPKEINNTINNYIIGNDSVSKNGMNNKISLLIYQLKQATKQLTMIHASNNYEYDCYKDVVKVDRKTGEKVVQVKKMSDDEYYNQMTDITENIINQTLDGIAFDIVQDVVVYLLEAWKKYHKTSKSWLYDTQVELVQKNKILSEKAFVIDGKDKPEYKEKTFTVRSNAFKVANVAITEFRAIQDKFVNYNDLLDYADENAHLIVKSEVDSDDVFRMKKLISKLNLSKNELTALKCRFYGINCYKVIDGKKQKVFIDSPTNAEIADYMGLSERRIRQIFVDIQTRVLSQKSTKIILSNQLKNVYNESKGKRLAVKIDEVDVKSGKVIATYNNMSDCAKKTGITIAAISYCVNGKRKTAGGRKFVYHADEVKEIVKTQNSYKFGKELSKETKLVDVQVIQPKALKSFDKMTKKQKAEYLKMLSTNQFITMLDFQNAIAKSVNDADISCNKISYIKLANMRTYNAYFKELYFDTNTFDSFDSWVKFYKNRKKRNKNFTFTTKEQDKQALAEKLKNREKNNIQVVKSVEDYELPDCEVVVLIKGTRRIVDTIYNEKKVERVKAILKEKGILDRYEFIKK